MKRRLECSEDGVESTEDVINSQPSRKRVKLSSTNNKQHKTEAPKPRNVNNSKDNVRGIDKQSCKQQLKTILSTVSKYGAITMSGICNNILPDICGLYINGIGNVPLPLSSAQANIIFSLPHCKIAGFEHQRNKQLAENENVGNTYEINSTKFKFENMEYNTGVSQLINKVGSDLGISSQNLKYMSYQQSKLLIYGPGGDFVSDPGNAKQLGIFATLIVQLPSMYSMIKNDDTPLIVKYNNQAFKHDFGLNNNKNKYHCHYASFYCDLTQKVNKIKDGYRVCVMYNLFWNKNSVTNVELPNISKLNEIQTNICNVFRLWNYGEENNDSNVVALELNHEYTQNEIEQKGINCFEGKDLEHTLLLLNASKSMVNLIRLYKAVTYFMCILFVLLSLIGHAINFVCLFFYVLIWFKIYMCVTLYPTNVRTMVMELNFVLVQL